MNAYSEYTWIFTEVVRLFRIFMIFTIIIVIIINIFTITIIIDFDKFSSCNCEQISYADKVDDAVGNKITSTNRRSIHRVYHEMVGFDLF